MTRTPRPRPERPLLVALSVLVAGLVLQALGCANGEFRPTDPFDRGLTFSESQHRYTVLVRWTEFQKAKAFVADDQQESFLENMKALEHARFTDYESEDVELDEEKQKATVRVTYTAYLPSSPYELEIVEVQDWTRDGIGNKWRVRSRFEGVPKVAAN
jgi:hypothetical protein